MMSASWIRSEAGQQDLPALLSALCAERASAANIVQPAAELKKPLLGLVIQTLEAEEWCTQYPDCLKHLAAKQGKGLRGVWPG